MRGFWAQEPVMGLGVVPWGPWGPWAQAKAPLRFGEKPKKICVLEKLNRIFRVFVYFSWPLEPWALGLAPWGPSFQLRYL